ncbi:MAG: hypothetical protein OHM77_06060 [Candidatus Nitricoxidivorans perseverans]|uniref:YtkA-like domain-containing protein n=1 Tax=Candidatus Nitricoxidivorans perseverans TaxID=2975601 RepID=A0AA49FN13_9PROT|nr:MAG: hypothetical protein OHM77_06060 [Candidatus Nitricoxidivorans perseverans]
MPNKHLLIDAAVILALLLTAAAGYWLSPFLLPKVDVTATPMAGCDLHRQPCAAILSDGGRSATIELSVTPRPIPMIRPLRLEVAVAGVRARKVEVDFAGKDMNMGYNRPALESDGSDRFVGQATLPVCITGEMAWKVTVLVETDRERIAAPFLFYSNQGDIQ